MLAALVAASSFADSASLTKKRGVQTLTISGMSKPGQIVSGVMYELPSLLMNADNVLKVKHYADASSFEGHFISGDSACPVGRCSRHLVIEQKQETAIVPGRGIQTIDKGEDDTYEIRGEAAEEIYNALVDAGEKPRKAGKDSKSPTLHISGESFDCSANPLGGMKYKCTISVNGVL